MDLTFENFFRLTWKSATSLTSKLRQSRRHVFHLIPLTLWQDEFGFALQCGSFLFNFSSSTCSCLHQVSAINHGKSYQGHMQLMGTILSLTIQHIYLILSSFGKGPLGLDCGGPVFKDSVSLLDMKEHPVKLPTRSSYSNSSRGNY